ncbi:hypothetical protein PBY51_003185 [Eleginops maclovinus]|uniref:Uncharacterized protein n=1 Tax=Eleginops maclovinus TaxID=56733 RepID=A0AAN8AK37_ELEMC|nr:hypothetical protein PBY51_003185 [Eleginops maclovinus]
MQWLLQLKLPVVPPVLSCTEGEQQWHKPRTLGVKPGPVDKMAVLSAKPKCGATTEGVRSTLYKALSGDLPDLSVLQVSEVFKDFSAAEAPMICSMGISCEIPGSGWKCIVLSATTNSQERPVLPCCSTTSISAS